MATIYQNNDVEITSEKLDEFETKINVNGKNLIWISSEFTEQFKKDLSQLLDNYRI